MANERVVRGGVGGGVEVWVGRGERWRRGGERGKVEKGWGG